MRRFELLVGPRDAGTRLDVLVARLPGMSRGRARRLIDRGAVWVDGRRVRVAGKRLGQGRRVVVFVGEEAREEPDLTARVLYLDDHLVAVDKPAGLPAVPTPSECRVVVPVLLARQLGWSQEPVPVHRLDRDTTGVMVLARDRDTANEVAECLAAGKVQRHYLALAMGMPEEEEGVWDWPVERDPRRVGRWRIAPAGRGKPAVTKYRVLGPVRRLPGVWALALQLVTGRTHQIRLHMAHAGLPVLGDRWYGAVPPGVERMYLHSHRWKLSCGKRRVSVEADPEWRDLLNPLRADVAGPDGAPRESFESHLRFGRET